MTSPPAALARALLLLAATLVVTASRAQATAVSVPDERGGTLVVWEESRRGSDDLYAQRLDAAGAPLWPDTGAVVCGAHSEQRQPAVVADGSGGAIVAWIDDRGPYWKVHVQHLDSAGVRTWGSDGVIAAPDGGLIQFDPQVTSDGAGGVIVTWQADNGVDADIHAQRVNAAGVALWGTDGTAACIAPFFQWYPTLCSDGAGGAIIAWMDPRTHASTDYDIFAQRVNASGVNQWGIDGVMLCTAAGRQENPLTIADGSGGAIVAWQDQRAGGANADLYAQRVNAVGTRLWTSNGRPLTLAAGHQLAPSIAPDGAGGVVAAWQDQRGGGNDVYAQRLDPAGAPLWTANSTALCTAPGDQLVPSIAGDGAGGAWVAWQDRRGGAEFDVFAQRVTAGGGVALAADGVPGGAANGDQLAARALPDGAGGAVVVWLDYRAGDPLADVYAQRLGADGAPSWAANGAGAYVSPGIQFAPLALTSGDGVILAWKQKRGGEYDVCASAHDANGAPRWAPAVLCGAAGNQAPEAIVSDGAGGAIVAWADRRAGNAAADIFAARVTDVGGVPWTLDGVAVCAAAGLQFAPAIAPDGGGGAIVAWQDRRLGANDDVYAQRLDAGGAPLWTTNGVALGAAPGVQSRPAVVADGVGGAIVAWSDARAGTSNADVYAQRVNGAGTPQWATNGVPLGTEAGEDGDAALTADGAGGAIAAWVGRRGTGWRAFGQRVDASGTPQWGTAGTALCLCDSAFTRKPPAIVPDGAGGAVVVFADKRDSGCVNNGCLDVYAQRVDDDGVPQWGGGVGVVTAPGDQDDARLVAGGDGGAIVAWRDFRGGARPDVFVQRLDGAGEPQWLAQGVRVATDPVRRMAPAIASDGAGGAHLAWQEQRDEYRWLLGAARLDAAGDRVWSGVSGVEPPARDAFDFALEGPWPNPTRGALTLALTLPRAGEGTLELVDLAGRRLARRTFAGLAPGRHVLRLDVRLAPGLYFVRLAHAGRAIARKACVIR